MPSHELLNTFVIAGFAGIFLVVLAQKLRVSSIVLLLGGGYLLGPEVLGWVHPRALGDGLSTIVSLAVGLILFEGGLTLDAKGYRQSAGEISGLLTKGVLTTWLVSAAAIYFTLDFTISFSLLSASLIIVTGPTVIGPLLKRVRVPKPLHQILYWEGVLIDPIGVFISLLCYEWILTAGSPNAYLNFVSRFLVGIIVGGLFGFGIDWLLKKGWIPDEKLNVFMLTVAMLDFAAADAIYSEAGLLSVTVTGFILGYKKSPKIDRVITYKVELKDYLVGLLFILLAGDLEREKFVTYGLTMLGLVAFVMFVVRPLNIWVSTTNSKLKMREKLFLCWIAPRGIVAASMASLFALHLGEKGFEHASFLQAFAYAVIGGTVVVQGFSAKWVAKLLGVWEKEPDGWMIIGSHQLSRTLALYLQGKGLFMVLVDSNPREVKIAQREGLNAIHDNAMTMELEQHMELNWVGHVFAVTENEELNRLICQRWNNIFSKVSLYYWTSTMLDHSHQPSSALVGQPVWSHLPLKSIIANSISQRELIVCEDRVAPNQDTLPSHHLLFIQNDLVTLERPKNHALETSILYLQPPKQKLLGPTKPEWTVFSTVGRLDLLYADLLELAQAEYPMLNSESLLAELVQREKEFSSLLGFEISLPHVYCSGISKSLMLVAKLEKPVQTEAGDLISLVFLVISPEDQPEEHLAQISKIAKFISSEEHRMGLQAASDATELYLALSQS